ncbi:hypothetical protein BDP55DRAFT_672890 [Colletotrichum godetiae]|uniref:Uncharacterized protein n=1 Tax=Colletotrichum godetiae TaxID=1209918 RepID=A0AAJ0EUU3_9PEZI|nr:uncharacterized protein BDP55DRAFT_672890 [Colletotrichum godetiae]KAK1672610.1 hypothetical protein BDP55DRAFT_672890 [Colletotrichum godetiae]
MPLQPEPQEWSAGQRYRSYLNDPQAHLVPTYPACPESPVPDPQKPRVQPIKSSPAVQRRSSQPFTVQAPALISLSPLLKITREEQRSP